MTSWVCLWKHEQRKPYVNRWRNKPAVDNQFIRGLCRCISIRKVSLRCPHATTASQQVSPAGITGSSYHTWLHPVAQLVPPAGLHRDRVRILIGWKPALRGFMQRGPRCAVSAAREDPRPPLRGFCLSWSSFPQKGEYFCPFLRLRSAVPGTYNTECSRELRLDPDAETNVLRSSSSDFKLALQEDVLYVVTRCPHAAPRRLKIFSRKTGKNASDILFSAPACFGHTSCCADFLLQDRLSCRKTSFGSSLRRPHTASALIQDVLLEKGIRRSTFTNRPCRPDLASVRALSCLF